MIWYFEIVSSTMIEAYVDGIPLVFKTRRCRTGRWFRATLTGRIKHREHVHGMLNMLPNRKFCAVGAVRNKKKNYLTFFNLLKLCSKLLESVTWYVLQYLPSCNYDSIPHVRDCKGQTGSSRLTFPSLFLRGTPELFLIM